MKNSRTIVSRGRLFSDKRSLSDPQSGRTPLKYVPFSLTCNSCDVCSRQDEPGEIEISGLTAPDLPSGTAFGGVPVNITIDNGRIYAILWHTLLLPLSGFIFGATSGYVLLQSEIASIVGAVAGLLVAVCCTRQVPDQAVSLELAADTNHGENM